MYIFIYISHIACVCVLACVFVSVCGLLVGAATAGEEKDTMRGAGAAVIHRHDFAPGTRHPCKAGECHSGRDSVFKGWWKQQTPAKHHHCCCSGAGRRTTVVPRYKILKAEP